MKQMYIWGKLPPSIDNIQTFGQHFLPPWDRITRTENMILLYGAKENIISFYETNRKHDFILLSPEKFVLLCNTHDWNEECQFLVNVYIQT